VDVGTSGVVAVIAGGAVRQASAQQNITLDASSSYDVDYPNDYPSQQGVGEDSDIARLRFRWTCLEYAPNYGAVCPTNLSRLVDELTSATSRLYIPSGTLNLYGERSYQFAVSVSNHYNVSASTGMLLHVSVDETPQVLIESVDTKYNPGARLTINGSVRATPSLLAQSRIYTRWTSVQLTTTELQARAVVAVERQLPEHFQHALTQLVLAPFSLEPGVRYTFRLLAGASQDALDSGGDSFAEVSVVMNEPPGGGSLSVSPLFGYGMNTTFHFKATAWTDDVEDYPLKYSFAYYTLTEAQQITVKAASEQAYAFSYLSEGLQRLSRQVTCVVNVTDAYLGVSSHEAAEKPIVSKNPNVGALKEAADKEMEAATEVFDSEKVIQVVGASISTLNSASCLQAPDCAALGRTECSSTSHTCGSCLAGLVGVSGDANTPCFDGESVGRRRLAGLTGDACTGTVDCVSGSCVSDPFSDSKVCASALKQCPGDQSPCLQRGVCQPFDRYESPLPLNYRCLVEDPLCRVECVCYENSYGRDCSLSGVEYLVDRATREVLVAGLVATLPIQEVTRTNPN